MSIFRDKQIKHFLIFVAIYNILLVGIASWFYQNQIAETKSMFVEHDTAIISSLLEQGVSNEVIATAIFNTEVSTNGTELLKFLGIGENSIGNSLPYFSQFHHYSLIKICFIGIVLIFVLLLGIFVFLWSRNQLFQQAGKVINNYIQNDYSDHLPQNSEGEIFRVFASVEQLATMLQSQKETEHRTKEFLKNTISDISHQLKTPLAALAMYQEIIEAEPDNVETVKEFSTKIGAALKRMEQLILSMLKITRLDTGNIVFEKTLYPVKEVVENAINELTTRAIHEEKQIIIYGEPNQMLICDMDWTGEAIGNLVKNALDHTEPGKTIHITWEKSPTMLRIFVSDNGNGIAPEDIHHIFKRFYRSKHSLDTPGIGLGLPLAKSIIEGQGGLISVQSDLHRGTTFTISFLTKS